jgi:hypothetical protein
MINYLVSTSLIVIYKKMINTFIAIILLEHFNKIFKSDSFRDLQRNLYYKLNIPRILKDIRKHRDYILIGKSSSHKAFHIFTRNYLNLTQKNSLDIFDVLIVLESSQRKSSLFT